MFSIVLCHSGIDSKDYLWTLIFGFYVPGFFIISGYLYRPHDWKRTLKSFIIPIIFFSFLNLAFILAIDYSKGNIPCISQITKSIIDGYIFAGTSNHYTLFCGIWFIWVLLLCRFLMGDIRCISVIRKNALFVALILVGITSIIVNKNTSRMFERPIPFRILSCFPFMLMGYVAKPHLNMHKVWKAFIIAILFYFAISIQIGYINIWSNDYGGNYLDFFVYGLASSLVIFILCDKLPSCDFAITISKGTLLVLGVQPIIIHLCGFMLRRMGVNNQIMPWLISIMTILICYYPIKLCIKYCPILIGKYHR